MYIAIVRSRSYSIKLFSCSVCECEFTLFCSLNEKEQQSENRKKYKTMQGKTRENGEEKCMEERKKKNSKT